MIRFLAKNDFNVIDLTAYYAFGSIYQAGYKWTSLGVFLAIMFVSVLVEAVNRIRSQP
jgi:hypothetical protein